MGLFKTDTKAATYSLRIEPSGREIAVPRGDTVLQAALDQGIDMPHNCRVGSCTTCKCRLVSGRIKELSDTAYVLSDADMDAGMILACQTVLESDAVIESDC